KRAFVRMEQPPLSAFVVLFSFACGQRRWLAIIQYITHRGNRSAGAVPALAHHRCVRIARHERGKSTMRKSCQKIASRFIFIFAVFCITITGRTALAGSEEAGGEAVAAEPIRMSGQKVYDEVCIACHAPPGVGGAPALG